MVRSITNTWLRWVSPVPLIFNFAMPTVNIFFYILLMIVVFIGLGFALDKMPTRVLVMIVVAILIGGVVIIGMLL